MSRRLSYEGAVVTAPFTMAYERYSIESAHWWIAKALRGSLQAAKLKPADLDGFSVASFTLFPDTAVGLTQHLGLCPRWLDHIPMGGASGVVSLRRAARAVQAGDADIVACVAGDTNHIDSFRRMLSSFSRFASDASYPYIMQSRGCDEKAANTGAIHERATHCRPYSVVRLCYAVCRL